MVAKIKRDEFHEIVELLEEIEMQHATDAGGYPGIVCTQIPGYIVVSGCDENSKPTLEVYRYGRLLNTLRKAKQIHASEPDEELRRIFLDELPLTE